jgi:hypothetical protein
MRSVLTLCLLLGAPQFSGRAPAGQTGQPSLPSAEQPRYVCSTFTSEGTALTATVVGADIGVEITPLTKSTLTIHLPLNEAGVRLSPGAATQLCSIFISTSNRLAAIGLRDFLQKDGERERGILVVLVDLQLNQFDEHYFVPSRQNPGSHAGLVGFLEDSESLVIDTSSSFEPAPEVEFEIIDTSNGSVRKVSRDLDRFAPIRYLFCDTRDNLLWIELDPTSDNHRNLKSPLVLSVSLTGAEKLGPSVDSGKLHHEHAIAKWVTPPAVAFPTPTSIVFAETGWSAGVGSGHLWHVDLALGSIRVVDLHKDIGEALLHGLGLTWFEDVGSPAVLSPDGLFVAIRIRLTTTGPPYIVDSYISKGSRLVVVDLHRMRVVSSISPEHDREPVSFSLDHRDGKVTLLVNWKDGWKRLQFSDAK